MISFVVRVHNEEETLRESCQSLLALNIPIQIVIVLHRCTDRSKEIAYAVRRTAPARHVVTIVEYERPISRAGLETYLTASASPHSIMTYYDYAFSFAMYAWKFKWDADFIARAGFIYYVNTHVWGPEATALWWHHQLGKEIYAYNCLCRFTKQGFWETPMLWSSGPICWGEAPTSAAFDHIARSSLKEYWYKPPWFLTDKSEEALVLQKMHADAVQRLGPEPPGCARSHAPYKCLRYMSRCKQFFVEAP
jgi:hypothetical protein